MNYLIPANVKRGQYIFGIFRPIDLIIFGIGIVVTLILVAIMPMETASGAAIAVAPGFLGAFLVLPAAYYHNVLQLIIEIFKFFTQRRIYEWKGWCVSDESTSAKQ